MERERWLELYALAERLGRVYTQGVRYSVAAVVGVYLWAVIHDRPVSWACLPENWSSGLWRGRLPSQSSMSRRLRTEPVRQLMAAMEQALAQRQAPQSVKAIDSKPLVVGTHSKDKDAKHGRIAKGRSARGYKLHAVYDGRPVPAAWCVESMNVHDAVGATQLLPSLSGSGYLLGDSQYDSNRLYDLVGQRGLQLIAPRQKPNSRGLGHHYHSPFRLRSLALQQDPTGRALLAARGMIERLFSGLTSFGGGLAPLPAWVRTKHRVRLWVQAKLLVNALRILRRQPAQLASA